jgi:trehalose 6-phosphate phosphatase
LKADIRNNVRSGRSGTVTNSRVMSSDATVRLIGDRLAAVPPKRLLVVTDFDGTISEIVDDPAQALLLPEAGDAIQRLVSLVLRVAVISGRSDQFLRSQIPFEGVMLLGNYGQAGLAEDDRLRLDRFNEEGRDQIRAQAGVWLEAKPASSSIHFRSRPRAGPSLERLLTPLAERLGLTVRLGRMVLEVMPKQADKGEALKRLVARLRPEGVTFAGDDAGDRAAFEVTSALTVPHLAIGVASPEVDASTFAACDLIVDGPEAAAAFLSRLADWAEHRETASRRRDSPA